MDDRLNKILEKILSVKGADITNDSMLVEELGADSLSVVEIVMELETEFDVEIDDDAIDNITTVGELKELITDLS
jgi:acyl carrier protein